MFVFYFGYYLTTILAQAAQLIQNFREYLRLTKGNGNRESTLAMVYKLATEAQKHWRKINASELLDKVVQGVCFVDGIETNQKVA